MSCSLQVADFGLAKLTESGSGTGIVGTFGYMPPEYASYTTVLIEETNELFTCL
jgi:serine/threonine protein kinase